MSRKSTKQARFDSMSQRDQQRERKRKLKTGRKDGDKWSLYVLAKLEAQKDGETSGDIE